MCWLRCGSGWVLVIDTHPLSAFSQRRCCEKGEGGGGADNLQGYLSMHHHDKPAAHTWQQDAWMLHRCCNGGIPSDKKGASSWLLVGSLFSLMRSYTDHPAYPCTLLVTILIHHTYSAHGLVTKQQHRGKQELCCYVICCHGKQCTCRVHLHMSCARVSAYAMLTVPQTQGCQLSKVNACVVTHVAYDML